MSVATSPIDRVCILPINMISAQGSGYLLGHTLATFQTTFPKMMLSAQELQWKASMRSQEGLSRCLQGDLQLGGLVVHQSSPFGPVRFEDCLIQWIVRRRGLLMH